MLQCILLQTAHLLKLPVALSLVPAGCSTVLMVVSNAVSFDLWWNSVATMLLFLQAL